MSVNFLELLLEHIETEMLESKSRREQKKSECVQSTEKQDSLTFFRQSNRTKLCPRRDDSINLCWNGWSEDWSVHNKDGKSETGFLGFPRSRMSNAGHFSVIFLPFKGI